MVLVDHHYPNYQILNLCYHNLKIFSVIGKSASGFVKAAYPASSSKTRLPDFAKPNVMECSASKSWVILLHLNVRLDIVPSAVLKKEVTSHLWKFFVFTY